jgi:hypothetical protein
VLFAAQAGLREASDEREGAKEEDPIERLER